MSKHPGAGWMQPWRNPLGEILASLIERCAPLREEDRDESWYAEESQPEPAWSGLRFCKECGTGTLHREYWWAIEQETTIECDVCGGVWVTG